MYHRELRDELGLDVEVVTALTLAEVEQAVSTRPADVAVVMVSWAEAPARVEAAFRRLSGLPGRPKLVFLDHFAQTSTPYFGVLPSVDCYVKRQVLRRLSDYQEDFAGGFIVTDYLSRRLGFDLGGWRFGSKPDPSEVTKIVAGWNLGVTQKYRRLLKWTAALSPPWEYRPIAVNCRIGLPRRDRREWYDQYRELAQQALDPLRREYYCGGAGRVGPTRYLAELVLSKIVFSPFGWGEVCFRDYEAVCAGALLVKPSMDHLRTSPDIFVDGETYVAASWDLADVAEVCRSFLARPHKAKAIVRNAREAMKRYFERGGFVADVRRVLAALQTPAASAARVGRRGVTSGVSS
jgi:ATP:corrinoid adenosyltransferase